MLTTRRRGFSSAAGAAATRLSPPRFCGKEPTIMASDKLLEVTDDNFEADVLKSSTPVLIDFWAAWCAPCRAIGPHVDALAAQYEGKIKVGKCDIDANPQTPSRYDVRSIPTLLMFKDGQVVGQVVGAVPKTKLEDLIKRAL
jgi:thioredoxin 1